MNEPTIERLNELFYYKDGHLIWKDSNTKMKGKKAGCVKAKGYVYIGVDNMQFRAHRLIYLMHHGHVPNIVDHIDGDRLNNRIDNLQEISNSENLRKAPLRNNSTSGVKGICNTRGSWRVLDENRKYLGNYPSLFEAMLEAEQYFEIFTKFSDRCDPSVYEAFMNWKKSRCSDRV